MSEAPPFAQLELGYSLEGEINVRKDLVYKEIDGLPLTYDLYLPPGSADRGAIVFVHGEGPPEVIADAKDWGQFKGWGTLAAQRGMIGITFNHRSSHFFSRLPDVSSDIEDLLDHMTANADDLDIDLARIGLWVCSGGNPAGMTVGLKRNVGCIASFYGRMSLSPIRDDIDQRVSDADLDQFSLTNALNEMAPEDIPPILIAKGGMDELPGVNESIDLAVEIAMRRNLSLTFFQHAHAGHGFDVSRHDARTREIIAGTLRFLVEHLSPAS